MGQIIKNLMEYWQNSGIIIEGKDIRSIEDIANERKIFLPSDFIKFYANVNGMSYLFPNECDKNGFLFYPVEGLITMQEEFSLNEESDLRSIVIFSDYLQKSWYYGFRINKDFSYSIGIIPHAKKFKPITNSLDDFISLYLEHSDVLADYD
jgi:hypothetical protein